MFEACSINADHKDLIHDVAYDFYGERMATCSSDQFVKVWDQDAKGSWQLSASWKAHSGSVWKVTWAHPEFGQVLATCSFDRTAAVWEESGEAAGAGERGRKQWVRRNSLVDSRTSVTDIKFGPKTLGLLIATCSSDGIIRIYEAPDVMNLAQWTLQHEIPTKVPLSCLTWNPSLSRAHPPMVAAGSSEAGRIVLLEYNEGARCWSRVEPAGTWPQLTEPVHDLAFAPNLGRSYHLLAIATNDVRILSLKPEGGGRYISEVAAALDQHGAPAWRVCWNVTGTLLASSGDDATVRLWKMQYQRQWICAGVLRGETSSALQTNTFPTSHSPAPPLPPSAPSSTSTNTTARYYKLGIITNPGQVPWH